VRRRERDRAEKVFKAAIEEMTDHHRRTQEAGRPS
jgi:hypothetical protein